MVKDEDKINLNPIERIARVGLGALLLWFGTNVSNILDLVRTSYYTRGTIKYSLALAVSAHPDLFRILGWTLGFILIFTGANGFCPFYKILKINTNRKK